jgi:hypothetical protein
MQLPAAAFLTFVLIRELCKVGFLEANRESLLTPLHEHVAFDRVSTTLTLTKRVVI